MVAENVILVFNGKFDDSSNKYKKLFKKHKVIAVDGGALFLKKLGILPEILIGDMDSLTTEELEYFINKNIKILKYPVEKDKTDGELAFDYCAKNNLQNITILGGLGGRIDQQLANIYLLEYAEKLDIKAVFREPNLKIGLINKDNNKIKINEKKGWHLSLISLSKQVTGLFVDGCKYEVEDATLLRYKTLGISNKIKNNSAVIGKKSGLLLYILFKNISLFS